MPPLYMTLRDSQWSDQYVLLRAPTIAQYNKCYNETIIDYGASQYEKACVISIVEHCIPNAHRRYKSLFVNDDTVKNVTYWSTRGNK